MGLKEEIQEVSEEVKDVKYQHGFAWEIMVMLKQDNKRLFKANIILSIMLLITIILAIIF